MLIFEVICFVKLQKLGKSYPWKKPPHCPHCKGRIWGHGYVMRYFDGYSQAFFLKRYFSPDCGRVFCLRPKSHWPRFQASRDFVYNFIKTQCKESQIKPINSRNKNWLKYSKQWILSHFGFLNSPEEYLLNFKKLIKEKWVPISRNLSTTLRSHCIL